MLRRHAISLVIGAAAKAAVRPPRSLAPWMDGIPGAAVLIDIQSRRLIATHNTAVAAGALAPPGSTLKPIVLDALLRWNRLRPNESFECPGELTVAGRRLNCSHAVVSAPMRVETAIAYSCNCFVAHVATRFQSRELAAELDRVSLASSANLFGRDSAPARIRPAETPDATRLQALGEDGSLVTTAELALAYRLLALHAAPPVIAGLQGAVQYGTARHAAIAGWQIAGKTGSVDAQSAGRIAWFAGFAPTSAPQVAIALMAHGHSGGADAAPAAGRIFEACRAGNL